MIVSLFIPPIIRGKRVYSEKVLGISIENGIIRATVLNIGRFRTVLEKTLEKKFNTLDATDKAFGFEKESLKAGIKDIIKNAGSVDKIKFSIPSKLAVFKEVDLPVSGTEKIKKIIDFEAETFLPLSLDEASFGFLKLSEKDQGSKVLVCGMKNSDLDKFSRILDEAKVSPSNFFLDAISLHNLVLQTPTYLDKNHVTVLIDFLEKNIIISFIKDGIISKIRILEKGLEDILCSVSKKSKKNLSALKELFSTSGINHLKDKELEEDLSQAFKEVFKEIEFSVSTFMLSANPETRVGKVVIIENNFGIKNFDSFLEKRLKSPCEMFSIAAWMTKNKIRNKASFQEDLLNNFSKSIACASSTQIEYFFIGKNLFINSEKKLLRNQILTSGSLVFFIFFYLFFYGSKNISSLSATLQNQETELVKQLKEIVPKNEKVPAKIRFKKLF